MSLGEFQLIEKFFSRPGGRRSDVVLGVGDDAAIVRVPPGEELVVAADTIVSGVHFPPDLPPEFIGYRALAVNLSDMAAMGATPAWCTLSLTLPAADEDWLESFSRGFLNLAAEQGVALIGGDTTSGPLTIAVQILGLAPQGAAIRRSGASVGDAIFVSGCVGDAAAGLALIQGRATAPNTADLEYLQQRFSRPTPRVALGLALRGIASAAIDVSDGLHADLGKLVAASGTGARLDLDALPLSEGLLRTAGPGQALEYALAGGDDYELCFTVPQDKVAQLDRLRETPTLAHRRIGVIEAAPGVRGYQSGQAVRIETMGYDHFLR